jgi:hypothetical protein
MEKGNGKEQQGKAMRKKMREGRQKGKISERVGTRKG